MHSFFRLLFPVNRKETIIFFALLIFYLLISFYFAIFTPLIDHPFKETDMYFSFDNPLIFKYGRSHINAHPLTIIFYYPFVVLGNMLASVLGMKAKTLLFAFISSSMVSLSCLYINRYIREIIQLKGRETILFTVFYAVFSTNLILCFTPETFTLAAFFLSYSAYYYAYHIKYNKPVSISASTFLSSICLGGVTITNFVKGVIPIFFLNEDNFTIAKKAIIAILTFLGILISVQIGMYLLDGRNLFQLMMTHKGQFTSVQFDSHIKYIIHLFSNFWGAPILFPEVINNTYYSYASQQVISMINVTKYNYWWQSLYVLLLTIGIIFSVIKNYKNKFVQILLLLLSVDLSIHCLMKFGIDTPFLYGGHWVYTIPLFLAWLFKSIENKKYYRVSSVFLFFLFLGLLVNNIYRLVDFAELAKVMFPI